VSPAAIEAAAAAALITAASADAFAVLAARRARGGRLEWVVRGLRSVAPGSVTGEPLRARATAAGLGHVGDALMAAKLGLALLSALVTLPVVGTLEVKGAVLALCAVAAGGFFAPDLMIRHRIASRRRQIAIELPAMLDLLAVTVGAGLPVSAALHEVGLRQPGLLGGELKAAQVAVQTGDSREHALSDLRARCPHEGVAAMVAAVGRAERHGAQLVPTLEAIATDARQSRARAIREHAAKAAPQIQLVIALGLVPATMLIVAAGLLASLQS
jgi:tight adherence protein C